MGKEVKLDGIFSGIYKNKKVLVTGHTGFKGAWLCLWLTQLGAKVAGLSQNPPTTPSLFESLSLSKSVTHFEADICQLKEVERVFQKFQPDIVFHLAAQPIVRKSYDVPKLTFDVNLGGTVNILEALRTQKGASAAVMITTDKVYENKDQSKGYVETDQLGGSDPYSASKACAELAVSSYFRSFFKNSGAPRIATARAGNVIGGGDWAADRIIPDCVKAWLKKEDVIVRKPEAVRPWQHVLEPLSGYLWLGARLSSGGQEINGEAFNFGPSDEGIGTVGNLTNLFLNSLGGGRWKHVPLPGDEKKEMNLLTLNCKKADQLLSWRPILDFTQTVNMTADWYKNFYQKNNIADYSLSQINQFVKLAQKDGIDWSEKYLAKEAGAAL